MEVHVQAVFLCRIEPTDCASFIESDRAVFLPVEGLRADGGRGLWVALPSSSGRAEVRCLVGVEGESARVGSAGLASSLPSPAHTGELLLSDLICARPRSRGLAPRTFFLVPACDCFISSSCAADFCCRFIK